MDKCEHCEQEKAGLIAIGGHSVCPSCIESLSAQVGSKKKRLARKREGKQIAGVCGGIAEHVEVDADTVRFAVIMLTIFTGFAPCLIGYAILTYFLPVED